MKLISACLLLGLLVTPAAALDDYSQFLVPASDAEILYSATYADCIAASGGVTATMQDCMDVEYERLSRSSALPTARRWRALPTRLHSKRIRPTGSKPAGSIAKPKAPPAAVARPVT